MRSLQLKTCFILGVCLAAVACGARGDAGGAREQRGGAADKPASTAMLIPARVKIIVRYRPTNEA